MQSPCCRADLLAERRFLLQFPARARTAGQPGLAADLLNLLGANQVDAASAGRLPAGMGKNLPRSRRQPNRREKHLRPPDWDTINWLSSPCLRAKHRRPSSGPCCLPGHCPSRCSRPQWHVRWRSACVVLGLDEASFDERLEELDHFLDSIEALQEKLAVSQGL